MNKYTEVGAVVTHPAYAEKRIKHLVAFKSNFIFKEHKTPYLLITHKNLIAISRYKKLCCYASRKNSFWNFTKADK
jgi:hypothetical protein